MLITIYDSVGNPKVDLSPNDSSTQVKEVQGDSVLTLSFTHYEHIELDVDDYADFLGERFWLTEKYRPRQNSQKEWVYDLKLYGVESMIKRLLVIKTVDDEENPVFTLTAPPRDHVALIVKCMNDGMGNISDWKVGQVDGTENIVIDYFGKYCDEALKEIAEKVGAEWWVEGQTVNICKCEHGEPVALGYNKGLLSIDPGTADNVKFYTRLYPMGSSRNIDREKYGFTRLQLPGGQKYVEINADKYGRVDHFEQSAFEDIYPRRIGSVSSVRSEVRTGEDGNPFTIYYFTDNSLPFDPNDYMIGGLVIRVSFQEGSELAGLGEEDNGTYFFEVNFNSKTREFEIITIWPYDNDIQLPGDKLVPKAGDKYILWNLRMPDEYYALAEEEFLTAVNKYNADHNLDISVYKAPTDHVWIEDNAVELTIGRRVRLESEEYFPGFGFRDSRITKITRKVNLPSSMDIEISDALSRTSQEKMSDSIADVRSFAQSIGASVSLPDIIRTWDKTLPTDNNLFSSRKSLQTFLNKTKRDSAKEVIAFEKGVEIGKYMAGVSGGVFGIDPETGDSFAEVARLYVRVKAFFEQLTVIKAGVLAGKQYITPGGSIKCTKVEEVEDEAGNVVSYRCYFLSEQDGEKTDTKIVADDQVVSEMFNAKAGTTNKVSNHRYWRLVTAVNNDAYADDSGNHYGYIDLSATDCESGSNIPEAGDEICQLGNRTDKARQTAMIFSTVDADAPSIKLFGGIDSYTLVGKDIISQGYDPIKAHAFFKCFGDAYIGDPGGSTYVSYDQDSKSLVAKLKLTVDSIYGDKTFEDWLVGHGYTDDTFATKVKDQVDKLNVVIDTLGDTVDGLRNFTDAAFADGIIDRGEASAIQAYLRNIETVQREVARAYASLEGNSLLPTTLKTLLVSAKAAFDSAASNLIAQIEDAVADGLATSEECSAVNTAYTTFNTKYGDFVYALNQANTAIMAVLDTNINKLDYLKAAYKQSTTITNGLVLTSVVSLGVNNADYTTQTAYSGISGIYDAGKRGGGIAAWYGGDMIDKFDFYNAATGEFSVPDGTRVAMGIDRMDGTGYRAGGNLWWDADGVVHADPLSFFVGENTVGALLASFQVVLQSDGKHPEYLIPKVPFQDLSVSNILSVGNYIKIGNGLLKWDEAHKAFYVEHSNGSAAHFYATGGVTALGIGDGSSSGVTGGSAYDRYDGDWKDFVAATHNTWVVSGKSGKVLYDIAQANAGSISSLASRIASLEGGSALNVQTTGSGNVVSSVTKSGTTITVTKGVTALTQHQSLAAYLKIDGSNGTQAGVNALLNKLPAPSIAPSDETYIITSGTNDLAGFYRRPISMMWDYIKTKADSQYVKKAGDTMTGPLTVQTIHGINGQLGFFTDVAYISGSQLTPCTAKNGAMDLGKSDGRWRNVYSVLGNFTGAVTALSFASTVANGTAPFTVASSTVVSNLNADMVDGVHVSGLFRVGVLAGSANDMTVPGVYKTSAGVADTPSNVNGNQLLHFNWDGNAANQMYFCYNDEHVYTRRKAGGTWRNWKTFAFLDSTVAAADKLATSRKLWGQPFDGTAPVNGDMTGVGNLTMAGVLSVTGTATVSGLITAVGGIKIGDATITWDSQHGALKIDKSIYSMGGVTTLGIGDGSSSGNTGSAYDRYDGNWKDYDASAHAAMVVSGKSGKTIYDLAQSNFGSISSLNTRVASLESGSALSVSTTGTGNVVTAVSKSGTTVTVTKGINALTAITKAMVENVLTGNIASHTHSQYLTSHQSLANYVTLSTAQTITGLKTIANEMLFTSAGWLQFNTTSSTTIAKTTSNVIHAGTDMAAEDDANLRFGSWFGIGWYPTIKDQKVERGKNAMWLNVRNGHLYVAGGYHVKNGTASQFLKADGSLDSTSYLSRSGGSMLNTNLVSSLNADMLDGLHASSFCQRQGFGTFTSGILVEDWVAATPWTQYAGHYASVNGWAWASSRNIKLNDEVSVDIQRYGALSLRNGNINSAWNLQSILFLPAYEDKGSMYIVQLSKSEADSAVKKVVRQYADYATVLASTVHAANQLATSRSLWGRPFNGTADVSGDMTGVGSLTASGTVASSAMNAFRAFAGNYGVIFRNDGANFYILQTAQGNPTGDWNSYRPFQLNLATGNVTIGGVLKVNHGGNVGIGTSSPAYRLDVAGTVRMTGLLTAEKGIKIGEATITWDSEHGALKVDKSLYSMDGVTALGEGDGGTSSGGAGVDLFWGPWSGYKTADHDGTAVSGRAGKEIYDLVSAIGGRVSTLEGGSALNVTTTGSGNVVTAVTKSGTFVTVTKGVTAALSDHKHGLLHDDLTVTISTATDSGWSMLNSSYKGFLLKSIRVQSAAPEWLLGDYSAGIAFGGGDTKGVMSMAYGSPIIKFAGGNGTGPRWWMGVKGTASKTYNLDGFLTQHQSLADYVTLSTAQTITGQKTSGMPASSWWDGRDKALIKASRAVSNAYYPLLSIKTVAGSWELGNHTADSLLFTYMTDTNYSSKTNSYGTQISFSSSGVITARKFASTVATGTAPLQVASTTAVANLNADMVDGIHANGLLTAFSRTGANNNTLSVTVGGTAKTASLYPSATWGMRLVTKADNGGRSVIVLIADVTSWKGSTASAKHYGFVGRVTESRIGGYIGEKISTVICRVGYNDSNTTNSVHLRTSSSSCVLPKVISYNGKYYLGLEVFNSGHDIILDGFFHNCLDTFTHLNIAADGSLPEGAEDITSAYTVYTCSLDHVYAATRLETSRTLWGRPFTGTANVSGDMSSVGNMTFNAASDNRQLSISTAGDIRMKAGTTTNWAWGLKSVSNDGATDYGYAAGILGGPGTFTRFFYGGDWNNPGIAILANKNVGIGTVSPAYKLDVNGTASMTSLRVASTTEAASVSSAAAVINGGLGVAKNIIVDQGIKTRLGITSTLGNSGSALMVAQRDNLALMQTTNGYGNNYIAVTKTYGENGIFIQQQNGRYGYEYAYMKKTDIEAGNNKPLSMFRLEEDGTVILGSYNDLGTERMDKFMTVYRTMRLYRKSGVAVDVKCNENNELEVNNVINVKNKIILRNSSGKTVELSIDSDGSLRVNNNVIATGGVTALA